MMKRAFLTLVIAMAACQDPYVPDDTNVWTGVAAGGEHTCAVNVDGEVYCWGRGENGQLGTGLKTNALTPRRTQSDAEFTAITVGDTHSCALEESGRVFCWGWNAFRQTGVELGDVPFPMEVQTNERFLSISAGGHHTCGVAIDLRVVCWGYNRWGQNGNDLKQITIPPAATSGGLRATAVSAGADHTCAISVSGATYCWGSNSYGQLGVGSETLFSVDPVPVQTSLQFTRIDAGATHTCGVATDGRAYCWGSSVYGELGDGAPFKPGVAGPATPVGVLALDAVTDISAGVSHTCAVQSGATFCWGRGTEGQLGIGRAANFAVRQLIDDKFAFTVLATGGTTHACGIMRGRIYCWGAGTYGQLGTGSVRSSNLPIRISR
jgi:alpha-tubulin suppressor-like RCC1 family protein